MNYDKACEVLEIERKHLTESVKKAYFKQALKWHPDKPTGNEEKFKEVKEAYDYLQNYHKYGDKFDHEKVTNIPSYVDILKEFLNKYVPENKWDELFIETSFNEFMKKGVLVSEKISLDIFKSLSTKRSLELYELISNNYHIFNINEQFIAKMKENLREKMNSDNIIIINPTIDDMLNDNIYKLEITDENIIYVPLWHRKIYNTIKVDNNNNKDIMIMIMPPNAEDIVIKDNNDIYVKKNIKINEIFETGYFYVTMGEKNIKIDSKDLKLTKEPQMILLKHKGILKINKNDIYQKDRRANIIIEITLI